MKLASVKDCTACMACADACNHSVLKPSLDSNGYYYISVDSPEACTNCGMCSRVCPVLNPPQIKKKTDFAPQPMAVWTDDDELRDKCASGGAFGALAAGVIQSGGVVYGACIDGFRIRHRRAESTAELIPMLGSKYQQSEMNGIYRAARKDLLAGRTVLFSGLSCQVSALLTFLGKTDTENLITVDTVCGGLSTMLPMLALENSGRYSGIRSFRDKNNGWRATGFRYSLKMRQKDGGTEDLGLDNHVLNTFSSKLLKRYNCLSCRFNGIERPSDITIGDFWGDTSFPEQHDKGLSLAIVRTPRAMELVKKSLCHRATTLGNILPGNPNLAGGHYPLVRMLPTRGAALKYQRMGKFDKAWEYMSPKTMAGMLLRLAVKISK